MENTPVNGRKLGIGCIRDGGTNTVDKRGRSPKVRQKLVSEKEPEKVKPHQTLANIEDLRRGG